MAEIKVHRKSWITFWQLAVAFVIVILLIWVGTTVLNQDPDRETGTPRASQPDRGVALPVTKIEVPAEVTEFSKFIEENPAGEKMGLAHSYTSEGIRRLANAVESIAGQRAISDRSIDSRLELLRERADKLQENRHSTDHADTIRKAFELASDLMASIQQQLAPGLIGNVADVRGAAQAIDPDKLALEQKDLVEAFFKESSHLLDGIVQRKS